MKTTAKSRGTKTAGILCIVAGALWSFYFMGADGHVHNGSRKPWIAFTSHLFVNWSVNDGVWDIGNHWRDFGPTPA
jgi:hypothetical protein